MRFISLFLSIGRMRISPVPARRRFGGENVRPELSSGLASGFQRLIGLVAIYCCLTVTAPAATNPNWFKIVSLTTSNAVFADAPLAGSLAATADHLFASRVGDSSFRRWDANGLTNPTTFSSGFIIVSDLRTEKVYAFADASGTMTGTGTATALHELDPLTGQTNGVVIALSASVAVEDSCGPEFGIFCGWGRVVVGRSQLSDIAIPSGQVTALGKANPFGQGCDPSEPLTGVAEFFGDELYLVACQRFSGGRFERVRLSNGVRTTVATFNGMPSKTKLNFSPSRQRWYFSTESGWLGSSSEIIGYADATWDQSDEFPPPPPLVVVLPSAVTLIEDTTTNAFGSFTQRENADTTEIRVVESSNPSLLPTNRITFFGGGSLSGVSGAFEFVVNPMPNRDGVATLTFLTTNNVGERATNFLTVNVTPVNDVPSASWSQSSFNLAPGAGLVLLTNTLRLLDSDTPATNLVVRILADNALLIAPGSSVLLPAGTNRTVVMTVNRSQVGRASIYAELTDPADGSVVLSSAFVIQVGAAPSLQHATTMADTDFAVFGLGGMRGVGYGTMSVTGLVGTVKQATLYWHGPGKRDAGFSGALPENPLFGPSAVSVRTSGANCWPFDSGLAERGDVTALITGNTNLVLTNFLRQACGFLSRCVVQEINGASLLVFYDDGNPANNRDVMIYEGNDASEVNAYDASGWNDRLDNIRFTGGPVALGLHVSDGQTGTNFLDGALRLNGTTLLPAGPNFEGNSTPRSVGGTTNGSLWDIRTEDVTSLLVPGTNALDLTLSGGTDCLSLVVATVSLPAGSALPVADLSIRQRVLTATGTIPPTAVVSNIPLVTYLFTVTNAGPFIAPGVTVTNLFDSGVTVETANLSQGTLSLIAEGFVAALGVMSNGATATIEVTLRYPHLGFFQNFAVAGSEILDQRSDANPASQQFVTQTVEVRSITGGPAPRLTIRALGGSQYEISWTPTNAPDFVLQSSDTLVPPAWTNAPSGALNPVILPAVEATRFFRLSKP